MVKLFNIIHQTPLVNHEKVDYVNYIQYDINDPEGYNAHLVPAPTLVVGFKLIQLLYGSRNEIDILQKKVNDSLFWEFSYEENRGQHIDGVFEIVFQKILELRFHKINYEVIDPVFCNIRKENEILQQLSNVERVYLYKDMIYAYNPSKLTTYGVDLKVYDFFGFDKLSIMNSILSIAKHRYLDDAGDYFVEYKIQFPYVPNLKRYMVLLLQSPLN